jgi:hypothetical protein
MATVSKPADPMTIFGQLDPGELKERLRNTVREAEGLRTLIRIAERNAALVEREKSRRQTAGRE